ncbi:hypothetical protein FPY71_12665 [Aureimonas fodinaquatilis]|uniref:Calcium-binding protein n=1 Tax=Aureimonas fodinaquatilis TaxID=2565783 RepID=A0A5B0DSN1_9HYPH|nr:calcium-binding protein [Aureimonas fodinaquatilis]KAA0969398.1 hypothetical protein FPY71_12665 [Aureimonas fodinaquatilis]
MVSTVFADVGEIPESDQMTGLVACLRALKAALDGLENPMAAPGGTADPAAQILANAQSHADIARLFSELAVTFNPEAPHLPTFSDTGKLSNLVGDVASTFPRLFRMPGLWGTTLEYNEIAQEFGTGASSRNTVGRYFEVHDRKIQSIPNGRDLVNDNLGAWAIQVVRAFANLPNLVKTSKGTTADNVRYSGDVLLLAAHSLYAVSMTDRLLATRGTSVSLTGGVGIATNTMLIVAGVVSLTAKALEGKTSKNGMEEAIMALQTVSSVISIARRLPGLAQAAGVTSAGDVLGKGATGLIGGAGAIASIVANILVLKSLADSGASQNALIAAGTEFGLSAFLGALMTVGPSLGVGGVAIASILSMFSPTSLNAVFEYRSAANAAADLYATTGWQGDNARASYYGQMMTGAILGTIPLVNVFSSLAGTLANSDRIYWQIMADYGAGNQATEAQLSEAASQFWRDGFDSRMVRWSHDYIAMVNSLALKERTDRVVGLVSLYMQSDMAVTAAYLGGKFAATGKSNQTYFIGSDAKQVVGLASNMIDVSSAAATQYITFLTPFIGMEEVERVGSSTGKKTRYKPEVPVALTIRDGASASIVNLVSENGMTKSTTGKAGGLSLEMGGGDDIILSGAYAFYANGGTGIDGVDYRNVFTSHSASGAAISVTGKDPGTYLAAKSGYGDFFEIVQESQSVTEGKHTTEVVYKKAVLRRNSLINNQTDELKNIEWIFGSSGRDLMNGSSGVDSFFGGEGDDTLNGGAGNDYLSGDEGNDTLDGGHGDDALSGGAGNDLIKDASGANIILAGAGQDTVEAGSGADQIDGEAGNDLIRAGGGNDVVTGHTGDDTIFGGDGDDTLYGDAGHDRLDGDAGDDILVGGAGNDTLNGGSGKDTLVGSEGNDVLFGGDDGDVFFDDSGRNSLYGQAGDDVFVAADLSLDSLFDGGPGTDTWTGRHLKFGIEISLVSDSVRRNFRATGDAAARNLISMENVEATQFDDNITGNQYANYLAGLDGNDFIFAGHGNDTIIGGKGSDFMEGARGNDTFIFDRNSGSDQIVAQNELDLAGDIFLFTQTSSVEMFFVRHDNDLEVVSLEKRFGGKQLQLPENPATVLISNYFTNPGNRKAAFVDSNGHILAGGQVALLAEAMAQATDPGMMAAYGIIDANYLPLMQPVLAAAWSPAITA